jgi:hypothetical protein
VNVTAFLGGREPRDQLKLIAFAVFLILSLCPVLLVEIPAMVDYPNHLARMSVLARDGSTAENPFYRVAWGLFPNLAMDLIVPRLARILSVENATKSFYVFSQLLVVSGSVAIERVVKGRFEISGFAALLLLYSVPFAWGFVNFIFGLGVALWAIAGWLALEEHRPANRLALHTAATAALFVSHLFALGLYGFTVGIYELWRYRAGRATFSAILLNGCILALPAAALLAAMKLAGGSAGGEGTQWSLSLKLFPLLFMNGYSVNLSAVSTAALLLIIYGLAREGRLIVKSAGLWLAIGFALLFMAMPQRLFDTAFVDIRVVVAAGLVLPAFVSLRLPEPRWRGGVAACVAAIGLANLAYVGLVQASYNGEYAALADAFSRLKGRPLVLAAHSGAAMDPPPDLSEYPIYHAPTLAVLYANGFVPTLFTYPGKQPLLARPEYQAIDVPQGGPEPIAHLQAVVERRGVQVPSYIANWPRDFDYVCIVGPPIPNPMPALLDPVASGARFALYAIRT